MRSSHKNQLHQCYHSPYAKSKKKPNLQNILQEIKHLQNCVSQIDTEHNVHPVKSQSKPKKSGKKQKSSSLSHYCDSRDLKKMQRETHSSCNKYQNMETIRNVSKFSNHQSAVLKNYETMPFKSMGYNSQQCKKQKQQSNFEYPMSFVSLQVQNLQLQKQNLHLQKQLLQKQLMLERRQKQLLKNRLNKIKMHNLSNKIPLSTNITPMKEFKVSPIKINIPQFIHFDDPVIQQEEIQNKRKKSKKEQTKTFQSVISLKNLANSHQTDQLLISGPTQHQNSKQNQVALEKEFWTLLNQSQHDKSSKKWEIRQALGDIANKLKYLRKN